MKVEQYQNDGGRAPLKEWFDSLNRRQQSAVRRRIDALKNHNHFGDCRSLRDGLFELRLLGVGLRIYFARVGPNVILLLGGSDKGSQKRAIGIARKRLTDIQK